MNAIPGSSLAPMMVALITKRCSPTKTDVSAMFSRERCTSARLNLVSNVERRVVAGTLSPLREKVVVAMTGRFRC